jgi:hypothetical protein
VTTISEFQNLIDLHSKLDPTFGNYWHRSLIDNYDDFLKCLYKDLDQIVDLIQENRELRQNDSEDRLTVEIVGHLKQLSYTAFHDPKIGGHVDILVQKKRFKWLGEAKIYNGPAYLWQGFQQLCTRYSTGDSNQSHGGIIVYFKNGNVRNFMSRWSNYLSTQNLPDFKAYSCQNRPLAFYSEHIHVASGDIFTVRHVPLILCFDPQDKSGITKTKK